VVAGGSGAAGSDGGVCHCGFSVSHFKHQQLHYFCVYYSLDGNCYIPTTAGAVMACCCQPQNQHCQGICSSIDSRGFPEYLQIEISSFSGSLGDFAVSLNGTYTVPAWHISCKTTLGATCPSTGQDCGVYDIFLNRHNNPSAQKQCCGGYSGPQFWSPDPSVDLRIVIANEQRSPLVNLGDTLAVCCNGLVTCCDQAVNCVASGKWTYSNSQWISLLCSRTLDISGTASGHYRYKTFFGIPSWGSVSFNYRITVNDLP